jgi:hypothetical protein
MKRQLRPTSINHQLRSAIEGKRLIEFEYQALARIAEPHDYGVISGIEQLLVYQIRGESRSSTLPDWRLVRVAEIRQLKILHERFPGRRPVPSGKHKKWDQLFIRVSPAA